MQQFDFKGMDVLPALRHFLSHFPLNAETQEIDRIIQSKQQFVVAVATIFFFFLFGILAQTQTPFFCCFALFRVLSFVSQASPIGITNRIRPSTVLPPCTLYQWPFCSSTQTFILPCVVSFLNSFVFCTLGLARFRKRTHMLTHTRTLVKNFFTGFFSS